MKKRFILLAVFCLSLKFTFSQSINPDMIKSISFQKQNDNRFSNLIIGSLNERFSISFDVLSGFEHDLYYVIEHCDFNWKKSQLIKSEYIQGFDDVKIDNYSSSFNTYQIYTHYKVSFPNSNTSFKKSGNYIIKIIDEYGPNGISKIVVLTSSYLSRFQSGYLYHYAFAMLGGLVIILTWFIYY